MTVRVFSMLCNNPSIREKLIGKAENLLEHSRILIEIPSRFLMIYIIVWHIYDKLEYTQDYCTFIICVFASIREKLIGKGKTYWNIIEF